MNQKKPKEDEPSSLSLSVEKAQNNKPEYELGNLDLPISQSRERIIDAIKSSQVTIITAETGAGKSTQVPQFIAEQGLKAIVTQPRIVAARTVATRVSEEVAQNMGNDFDDFVGYATADDRNDSPDNQILYVTDGLQLVRELADQDVGQERVLVLDEIHEWNENMEVLVAWAKKRMNEDPSFKTVIMSATMDAEPLAKYFGSDEKEVPIIDVPGRTFEVAKSIRPDLDASDAAIELAGQGKNTLVFVPGKDEINLVIKKIEEAKIPGATVLPLHGQMSAEDQQKAFRQYPGAKVIVATNVAQTSITIDDINAVVDSGLERRKEVRGGVEGLYLRHISKADCLQRAGRAGRTQSGDYVLTSLELRNRDRHSPAELEDRTEYGVPEILRTRLDGTVLRLARNGLDATDLDFYHQPRKAEIERAKTRLTKLGALTETGQITEIGRDMERMPIESRYARMIIEARKYDKQVQHQMAAIVAIQESSGLLRHKRNHEDGSPEGWRALFKAEGSDSDLIETLEIFIQAQQMSKAERRDASILERGFSQTNGTMRRLRHRIRGLDTQDQLPPPTKEQRTQLMKCIVAGMVDYIYVRDKYGTVKGRSPYFKNNDKYDVRQLSNRSLLKDKGDIVAGTPFDLEAGGRVFELIEGITNVNPEILKEVAPQLIKDVPHNFSLNEDGEVTLLGKRYFDGAYLEDFKMDPAPLTKERQAWFIKRAATHFWENHVSPIAERLERIQDKTGRTLKILTKEDIERIAQNVATTDCTSVHDFEKLFPEIKIEDSISLEEIDQIEAAYPDRYKGLKLIYREGEAMIDLRGLDPSEEEFANLSEDLFTLPSGKSVYVLTYSEQLTLEEYRIKCRKRLVPQGREVETEQKVEMLRQWLPEEKRIAYDEARASGLPKNVECYKNFNDVNKYMGDAWVIQPDGSCRPPDYTDKVSNKRHKPSVTYLFDGTEYGECSLIWDQILPGEVAIKWRKGDYSNEHECEVVYTPEEGVTKEQLERIRLIENNLREKYRNLTSVTGKTKSPEFGEGWLIGYEDINAVDSDRDDQLVTDDMLKTLVQNFNN